MTLIRENQTVLFIGDSVTDCGRNREAPDDLGRGYVFMAAGRFAAAYPELGARFLNRGIGGHEVVNLQWRWQTDCLDLKPDWVSVLIGINDCWRRYDRNKITPAEAFETTYREILAQTRDTLGARLILMEPFVLPVPEDRVRWREDLDPKIDAVRRLAREFDALYVPLDGLFAAASCRREPAYWAADGVHPTAAGHGLIAEAWLRTVQAV